MMPSMVPAPVSDAEAMSLELQADDDLDVTSGEPRASVRELYNDDVMEFGVWEVTPGGFDWENSGYGELMHVLAGEATVTSEDGSTVELRAGLSYVAPPGWRGTWQVRSTLRKTYVVWKAGRSHQ